MPSLASGCCGVRGKHLLIALLRQCIGLPRSVAHSASIRLTLHPAATAEAGVRPLIIPGLVTRPRPGEHLVTGEAPIQRIHVLCPGGPRDGGQHPSASTILSCPERGAVA